MRPFRSPSPRTFPRPLRTAVVAWIATVAAIGAVGPARAADVVFRVRMAQQVALGAFDPAADAVDVAGSFNGWGAAPLTVLDGPESGPDLVYEVVLGGFAPGETLEFKFRINGQWDGSEEFPGGGPNRVHTVQAAGDSIEVWYGDVAPGGGAVDPDELAWWNDAVFYEVFVRSFADSDGDGIGDLPGLTAKLDYLNDGDPATDTDLGVTGLWLMPVNTAASYHGYDATDYRAIDPAYGTLADFEAFLAAAHARGIRVIVDLVLNHCSDRHPWFLAAAAGDPGYRDWFRWSADDPGETGPWGQQVWHGTGWDWYYGLFWSGMPDLNYDHPPVREEMFATAAWWLETVGVDGFRLDAVLYIDEDAGQLQNTPGTLAFWHDFGAHVRSVAPDALTVGEAWTGTGTVLQYVTGDRLDLAFEFDLAGAVLGAVNSGDARWLRTKAAEVATVYPDLQFATFLTNHDQDRVLDALGGDEQRNKLAASLYLTLPGVPFVYYGEEIGMVGSGAHEFIRSPMQWSAGPNAGFTTGAPWQPLNANYPDYNVATASDSPSSLLDRYRSLIRLRNASPALRRGAFAALGASHDAVLAYLRTTADQTLLCVANTDPGDLTGVALSGLAGSLAPGDHSAVDLLAPGAPLVLTVAPDGTISGLDLAGLGLQVFELVSATAAPAPDLPPAQGLRLEQNHPNPFNPATTIRFRLARGGRAVLTVHDLAGREVRRLVDGSVAAGDHAVRWDGRDTRGETLASGAYLYRLAADEGVRTRRMLLLK